MTLLGLSSFLDKNDSCCWVVIVPGKMTLLGLSSSLEKMTLLGLSSSLDKNDSAWVVIVHGQK